MKIWQRILFAFGLWNFPQGPAKYVARVYTHYFKDRLRWEREYHTKEEAIYRARDAAAYCEWRGEDPSGNPVSQLVGIRWEVTPL